MRNAVTRLMQLAACTLLFVATERAGAAGDDCGCGTLPATAETLRRTIDATGGVDAPIKPLLARWSAPEPYRDLLFYADGAPVRVAARCLVRLGDDVAARRILERVEQGELRTARYPARLFGWVVGTRYKLAYLRRLQTLLKRNDRLARIFALEALTVMTYGSWRAPVHEPDFANPGEVWRMRRFLASAPKPDDWLRARLKQVARRLPVGTERTAAARYLSGFRYPKKKTPRRRR